MIEIEKIKNNNFNEWLPLWNGFLEFYKENLPPKITDFVFKRLCDPNDKNMGGFIAFDGDKAIGFVNFVVHARTWGIEDVCYLGDLFVDPNVRGGGVGRALINKVADFAREENHRHVYWQTNKSNERAQILYEKMAGPSQFIVYKLKL